MRQHLGKQLRSDVHRSDELVPPRIDHTCVEASEVQSTGKSGVFDLQTSVHHDVEAAMPSNVGSRVVPKAQLCPEDPCAGRHCFFGQRWQRLGLAKRIDHVRR